MSPTYLTPIVDNSQQATPFIFENPELLRYRIHSADKPSDLGGPRIRSIRASKGSRGPLQSIDSIRWRAAPSTAAMAALKSQRTPSSILIQQRSCLVYEIEMARDHRDNNLEARRSRNVTLREDYHHFALPIHWTVVYSRTIRWAQFVLMMWTISPDSSILL
jgi:hypothetical protein